MRTVLSKYHSLLRGNGKELGVFSSPIFNSLLLCIVDENFQSLGVLEKTKPFLPARTPCSTCYWHVPHPQIATVSKQKQLAL